MNAVLKASPRWAGETVVCIASGPSLTKEDVAAIQIQHALGCCKVIAINREFEMAPWADVLYMADWKCWNEYIADVRVNFKGELWTVDQHAARVLKLNLVKRSDERGFCRRENTINTGGNSGYQAVHLAASWGASRILLLGYDLQQTGGKEHHYGKHRNRLHNGSGFKDWIQRFKPLITDLNKMNIQILNLTRQSALPQDWVPRSTVEAVPWN